MGALDDAPQIQAEDRATWRTWLEANHATSRGAWLVTWRPGRGRPVLEYEAAVEEARVLLKRGKGLKSNFLRLRALPCTAEVHKFIQSHERIYVVEANRDGQLRQILSAVMPDQASKFRSAAHYDGLPLTAKWIEETILSQEEE